MLLVNEVKIFHPCLEQKLSTVLWCVQSLQQALGMDRPWPSCPLHRPCCSAHGSDCPGNGSVGAGGDSRDLHTAMGRTEEAVSDLGWLSIPWREEHPLLVRARALWDGLWPARGKVAHPGHPTLGGFYRPCCFLQLGHNCGSLWAVLRYRCLIQPAWSHSVLLAVGRPLLHWLCR